MKMKAVVMTGANQPWEVRVIPFQQQSRDRCW
jgi:hypothetical protein